MKTEIPIDDLSRTTLFVRGIPASCSNETLTEVFSKAGTVKECFVVKYKSTDSENKKPCIGYVTFMSPDDAKTALRKEKDFKIDDSALKVSFSKKKRFSKTKKKKNNVDSSETVEQPKEVSDNTTEKKVNTKDEIVAPKPPTKASNAKDTFSVMVTGLPTLYKAEHVLGLWKKSGLKAPKEVVFPFENPDEKEKREQEKDTAKESKDAETVEIESKKVLQNAKFIVENKQAALKACNKLSGKTFGKKKNYILQAKLLTPEGNFKAARKSRLIVRNVSFKCTEKDLKTSFSDYGTVTEVKIPLKPDGRKLGFAFVQFSHVFEAARAIKALNMQEIKGRKVAIDWSLPKEKYKEMNSANTEPIGEKKEIKKEIEKETESPAVEEKTPPKTDDNSDPDSDDDMSDDSGLDDKDSEEETSDDESEEEEESEDEEVNPYSKPLEKASNTVKKLNPKSSFDVHEGRTVFVLNLSYDTTGEQLSPMLEEHGEVCYTKIVMNHDTGMSKGCAFAQFKSAGEAKKCIDALGAERTGKFLDGREIRVVEAMSRGDTDRMRKDGKKKMEKEDKKNLYLGREGLVRPGTQAAEGLSQIELKKREKIENAKRAKLKNPNIFVSQTRLCFHNLPKAVDEDKLREMLLKQFKDKKTVRITECRIMRDLTNLNEKGVGRPLGFAFINFLKHENALKALRSLNNNPDIFGPIKRPIVEFALENKKALEIKEMRQKKFVSKIKLRNKIRNSGEPEEKVKKIGRRVRQKMKRQALEKPTDVDDAKCQKNNTENSAQNKKGPTNEKPGAKVVAKDDQKLIKNDQKVVKNDPKVAKNEQKVANNEPEERKPFQGSTGTTLAGKKLPMPSHAGPKIRDKNRGKILEQMRKSKKLNTKAAQLKLTQKYENQRSGTFPTKPEKKPQAFKSDKPSRKEQKRKNQGNEEADFNTLVAKYTKKFMDKTPAPQKSDSKWYEG